MIIRPATFPDANGIAKVQVNTWKTTYKGIFPGVICRFNRFYRSN